MKEGPEFFLHAPLFSGSDFALFRMTDWQVVGEPVACSYGMTYRWRRDAVFFNARRGCFNQPDQVRIGLRMRDDADGSHPVIDWLKGRRKFTRWLSWAPRPERAHARSRRTRRRSCQMRSVPATAASTSPPTVAIMSATASGVSPSQPRNRTSTGSVFWAMKTISRISTTALPTTATHSPLVREPRNGSRVSGVRRAACSGAVGSDVEPGDSDLVGSGEASLSLMVRP